MNSIDVQGRQIKIYSNTQRDMKKHYKMVLRIFDHVIKSAWISHSLDFSLNFVASEAHDLYCMVNVNKLHATIRGHSL